ncbi:hypothetical protein CRUP_018754, partial [Coryphaenoides rupestris]
PRYVEQQKPQEQVDLLTNDDHVKETCKKLLKDLHKYHKNYYPIRELHIMCLEGSVWEKEEYQLAMQLLRMLAKEELLKALKRSEDILRPCKSKKMKAVFVRLQQLLDKFEHLDETKIETAAKDDALTSPGKSIQKKTDLFQL